MPDDQPRPLDDLQAQLDRIEQTAVEARDEARLAREESQATNGRLRKVEDDLYGAEETRRRENAPGLVAEVRKIKTLVYDVVSSRDEAGAVGRALKIIIWLAVAVLGVMIPAIALMWQIAGST